MNTLLKRSSSFENESLKLRGNNLIFKENNRKVSLSKYQHYLLVCLLNKVNAKEDIIRYLWGEQDYKKKENNYNQLVYQFRQLLIKSGGKEDSLVTLPRYGICLNPSLLAVSHSHRLDMSGIVNDHMAYLQ